MTMNMNANGDARRWLGGKLLPLLAAAALVSGCELDISNPNALTEEEVLNTPAGIIALAVGMQGQLAGEFDEFVQGPGLVTDELGTPSGSLLAYRTLFAGPASEIDADFGVVEEPFANAYRVVRSANALQANAGDVGLDAGTVTGIEALAKLFKAMALGYATMHFEQVPIDITADNPLPRPRAEVLDSVLALLEDARSDLAGVAEADLEIFRSRVLGSGFIRNATVDPLRSTIDAMLARYYLLDGQYQAAIDAAARVDQTVLAVFTYPSPDINPIYNLSLQAGYVAPLYSFVTGAEPGDQRVGFWVDLTEEPFTGLPDSLLIPLNQYSERNDPIPVYLPDEATLIQAEAYTRLGQFALARAAVNEVRTQTSSPVNEPVAALAALPPEALDTEAELLSQIAYERAYELYLQGLRWEDVRRLDPYVDVEPTITFFPLPRQECVTNPAAGCGN